MRQFKAVWGIFYLTNVFATHVVISTRTKRGTLLYVLHHFKSHSKSSRPRSQHG